MVEFALVLPILLFLALGIVDFGRAMNYWNNVNQIASDGARFAAVNKNPGDDLATPQNDFRLWVRSQAETRELREGRVGAGAGTPSPSVTDELEVCVTRPGGGAPAAADLAVGKPIEVRVETSYNLIPIFGDEIGDFASVRIAGTAVMRLEQPYTMETGCTA